MTKEEITSKLPNLKCNNMSQEEMCTILSQAEHTRSLCMWHDHATILKMGFILITVHVLYDKAVFYTDEEFEHHHPGTNINIQAEVEQPEIHFYLLVLLQWRINQP